MTVIRLTFSGILIVEPIVSTSKKPDWTSSSFVAEHCYNPRNRSKNLTKMSQKDRKEGFVTATYRIVFGSSRF